MTIFEKIIQREIPAEIVHEDDTAIAIKDINPQAPTHLLIVPKKVIPRLREAAEDDAPILGHLLLVARTLAEKMDLTGYRIVINNGPDAGETVPHLHVHLLAGRKMAWPPG